MKALCLLRNYRPLLLLSSLILLCSCAPPTTGGSAALKLQFAQIQQQQRQQAEQLEALQQQLGLLQQQATGEESIATPSSGYLENIVPPVTTTEILSAPAAANREIAALAGSAGSYLTAFSDLATGRYAPAEAGFSHFLNEYPGHQYSANARYWLASSQLSQGKLQAAEASLKQIIVAVTGQEKAPAALVLLARVYRQQQLDREADEVLEQLQNRYPESAEAQQFYRGEESQ